MITLIILHVISDALLQSREMGKKKSEEGIWLLSHVSIIFVVFYVFTSWRFAFLNSAIHAVIDWNIWNLYKYTVKVRNRDVPIEVLKSHWKYWEDKTFYTFIVVDQALHISTLVWLYERGI